MEVIRRVEINNSRFSSINGLVIKNLLQSDLKINPDNVGQYVLGCFIDFMDYPHYKVNLNNNNINNSDFWVNGLDNKKSLHEAFKIFDSLDQAVNELNQGYPAGTTHFAVFQISIENEAIYFNQVLKKRIKRIHYQLSRF